MVGAGIIGALVAGGATASFAASSADSAATQSDTSTTDQTATTDQSTTGQAPAQDQQRPDFDPSKGGHTANGKTEELLTGDTATKVTEAALAAVPGATIERVETDAEGAAYEAHLVTSDGKHQTVTFDADYNVVEIQDGGGPGAGGPAGMGGGHGRQSGAPGQSQDGTAPAAPAAPATSNGSTSTTAGS